MSGPEPSAKAAADPRTVRLALELLERTAGRRRRCRRCRNVIAENARKRGQTWSVCTACTQGCATCSSSTRPHARGVRAPRRRVGADRDGEGRRSGEHPPVRRHHLQPRRSVALIRTVAGPGPVYRIHVLTQSLPQAPADDVVASRRLPPPSRIPVIFVATGALESRHSVKETDDEHPDPFHFRCCSRSSRPSRLPNGPEGSVGGIVNRRPNRPAVCGGIVSGGHHVSEGFLC